MLEIRKIKDVKSCENCPVSKTLFSRGYDEAKRDARKILENNYSYAEIVAELERWLEVEE